MMTKDKRKDLAKALRNIADDVETHECYEGVIDINNIVLPEMNGDEFLGFHHFGTKITINIEISNVGEIR